MRTRGSMKWWLQAVGVLTVAIVLAVFTNVLAGPYFERSFLDEASPLLSAGAPPAPTAAPETTAPDGSETAPAAPPTQSAGDSAGIVLAGDWRDGEPGHNGEGRAQVLRDAAGALFLRLEEFSVTNGPDLFVVLSPDPDGYADGSLNLGGLRATDGNINYDIPGETDLSLYRSAVIWCRSFDVTFAVATLEAP